MKQPQGGMDLGNPAWPLLAGLISYWGTSTGDGAVNGTTIVDNALLNEPSYDGALVKILSGPAAGQFRPIAVFGAGVLIVATAFSNAAGAAQQITAGTRYVILSVNTGGGGPGPYPADGLSYYGVVSVVPGANQFTIPTLAGLGIGKFMGATNPYYAFVLRKATGTSAAPQGELQPITAYDNAAGTFTTAAFTVAVAAPDEILLISPTLAAGLSMGTTLTHLAAEQSAVAINITATNAGETNVFNLATAATHYLVRSLRLKCADPGANTVTVRLYELVNGVLTQVDSFDITTTTFTNYFNLMDMFGLDQLAGDTLQVTVRASAGGPYAVTGQYSYAKAT